jgi:shikimate kinase
LNNLILCGFMGCGKTTVGKLLAKRLGLEYIDLDDEIIREAGMPIPDIFSIYGEAHFRDLEHEAVHNLARRVNCVVSTGGGAMTFDRNIEAIDQRDLVVFLDAPFEVCYSRIKDSDRPILRQNTPEQFQALFARRREAYRKAAQNGLTIDAGRSADEVAADIALLREKNQGPRP